ncbi:unnamed protein product, partial [marine sediment metagenome]
ESKVKKAKTVVISLDYPIEFGEESIKEIELRRPKASDIEHLTASPTMKQLFMIAQKCSTHPPSVFRNLDAVDALKMSEVVGDFLDSGQKTIEPSWS